MDATHSTDTDAPAPVVHLCRIDGSDLTIRVDRGPVSTWHTVTWTSRDGIHGVGHDLPEDVCDVLDGMYDAIRARSIAAADDERTDCFMGRVA